MSVKVGVMKRWNVIVIVVAGLVAGVLGGGALACSGDDAGGSADVEEETPRARCARLRDHLVEVQLQNVSIDREQHQAAFHAALGQAFVDDCVARMSEEARACALAAASAEALSACAVPVE